MRVRAPRGMRIGSALCIVLGIGGLACRGPVAAREDVRFDPFARMGEFHGRAFAIDQGAGADGIAYVRRQLAKGANVPVDTALLEATRRALPAGTGVDLQCREVGVGARILTASIPNPDGGGSAWFVGMERVAGEWRLAWYVGYATFG